MMFFQTPMILGLLIFPLGFFLLSFIKDDDKLKNFFDKDIREKLFIQNKSFNNKTRYIIFLLSLTLFIISLSRPVSLLNYLDITQTKSNIVLAIDVSKSMSNKDIFPTRVKLAKEKAQIFIKKATSSNIGVIFYADDAYLLYPINQEKTLLLELLKDANISKKFKPNTNLFSALQAGEFLLQNHPNKHIILFSDGGLDIDRKNELNYLKSKNITLSSLAITSKTNKPLKTLCTKSNGFYQLFTWSDKDIDTLIKNINKIPKTSDKVHHNITQYKEYFIYPLALSLVLLAMLFFPLKNGRVLPLVLFLITIEPTYTHAGVFDFYNAYKAQKALQKKDYEKAIKNFKLIKLNKTQNYNLAYALYKNSNYHQAIKHYTKALGMSKKTDAKIYYNIANAYVQKNKLDFAKEYYEKSLKLFPSILTQENLNIVSKELKKQRKNLHKKYEKLHFKAVAGDAFSKNSAFSNYYIKLHNFMPDEEERWFQKISNQKSPTYLQKIKTTKRSLDANISW